MGLSLQQLRDGVRKALGVDIDELSNPDVDLLLNTSWWQIADDFEFREKEAKRSYSTVEGQSEYAVAGDSEGVQQVVIEDTNTKQHTPLSPMTIEVYEAEYANTPNSRGIPERYVRRAGSLILWPTPNAVYTIIEYYWKTLADIAGGGPTIPQAWHEVIKFGAIWRGFIDYGDYNRSKAAKLTQMELMGTKSPPAAQEKADRSNAGVQIIRPRYR